MNENDIIINSRQGLKILYECVLELLKLYPNGLKNSEIAQKLELKSSHENAQHDYLTYSLLGNLMEDRLIKKIKSGRRVVYKING
ncbi:MAG: hypothetical protein LBP32_04470 [Spirochaetaceae bacterium]|nr:hypothetical protein [Spirochaetaceae bacterium]